MFGWSDFDSWVLAALFTITLLAFVQGTDFTVQPLLVAAASLITVPMAIAGVLSASPIGTLLLPLFFIGLVFYFGTLREWLGSGAFYYILFAAAVLVMATA